MSAPTGQSSAFEATYFPSGSSVSYDHAALAEEIELITDCEYWTLDRVAGTAAVQVELSWNSAVICDIPADLDSVAVCRWDGTEWDFHGQSTRSGDVSSGTVTSEEVISSFSPFAIGLGEPVSPLPIELLTFQASPEADKVLLEWATAAEVNNDFFTIERSSDGELWQELLFHQGSGNTSSRTEYEMVDDQPLQGISYYRLKQTDFDGSFEYFPMVAVEMPSMGDSQELILFPNPVKTILNVQSIPVRAEWLQILSVSGEMVLSERLTEDSSIRGDVSILQAGWYSLRVISEKEVREAVFLKQ